MSDPQRIQRERTKGWRMPPGTVNVTRGSDWGNPFRVGMPVAQQGYYADPVTITPALAVELFATWITERGWLDQVRRELAGKDLCCWCAPGQPCHGDWLLDLVNRPRAGSGD